MKQHITVGKDLLELISSAMYINPMSIYREYIQNGIDAIDEAVDAGLMDVDTGRVDVQVDHAGRSIIVCDNGLGMTQKEFATRMLSFGGSHKRGTTLRGFRGIGRLASLGYCQEIIFETKSKNENIINKVIWDCRKLKAKLADPAVSYLEELIQEVTEFSTTVCEEPTSFFRVTLNKVVRIKNDFLLNEAEVESYISQVCPVPFLPDFKYEKQIFDILVGFPKATQAYKIFLNNEMIYRPFENSFMVNDTTLDTFVDIEEIKVENNNGELAAVGWLLHHSYLGALKSQSPIRGLRARVGNIQIGDDTPFVEVFPEPRFNSWTVGEVHIVDSQIRPNGRRDAFEIGTHSLQLQNNLKDIGKLIANKCRTASTVRNSEKGIKQQDEWLKFEEILTRNNLPHEKRVESFDSGVPKSTIVPDASKDTPQISGNIEDIDRNITNNSELSKSTIGSTSQTELVLNESEQNVMIKVVDVIWKHYSDKRSARHLIEKIIRSL